MRMKNMIAFLCMSALFYGCGPKLKIQDCNCVDAFDKNLFLLCIDKGKLPDHYTASDEEEHSNESIIRACKDSATTTTCDRCLSYMNDGEASWTPCSEAVDQTIIDICAETQLKYDNK